MSSQKMRYTSLILTVFFLALWGSSSDSLAQTYDTVFENGDSSNRVDMIFIGDGYTASQIGTDYVDHVDATLSHFFDSNVPFTRYQSFFNAYRVNVISNESGADDPVNGITVDTALDASYNTGGTDRCLYFNTGKANTAVNAALAGSGIDIDVRLGTVNSAKYGGCGGQWAVYAGANSSANEIAIHEVGHSFGRLADEYFYTDDTYTGSEPTRWNLTTSPESGKWDRWVGYEDPDTDIGPIGYYEGGGYYEFGLYRPSDNSKMRALNRAFDAISREKFIYEIYEEADPLDDWAEVAGIYTQDDSLWVEVVDSSVINVVWSIGEAVIGTGESLDLGSLGLGTGEYQISALAYDSILDHAFSGDSLDWWRLDRSMLEQSVSYRVSITAVPEPSSVGLLSCFVILGLVNRRRRESQNS